MPNEVLITRVRPMGGPTVDVLVRDGVFVQIEPTITPTAESTTVLDGHNQLLLPGLVNAHAHVDKNLLGHPWRPNEVPGSQLLDFVETERRVRRALQLSAETQSAHHLRASIATGTTHLRSHIDVDTEVGLSQLEGVLRTREAFGNALTMQLVAFPQSGMLVRPGTVQLLEAALKLGADCIGGLDPSTIDRDPVKHLDTIFGLADRFGVEIDIHLHEPGMLGAFAVELIAERTRVLGLQGRVTISHVFCLGMVDEPYLGSLIELLRDNRITIMSLGSGGSPFPPLKRLAEAGVALCTGSDGVRDTWGPYNRVDMLDRVRLLGYRSGFRRDDDIELLLRMATSGGAAVMGDSVYGLEVGKRADCIVVAGDTPAEAVMEQPPRSYVLKGGRVVAENGHCVAERAR